jgi:XRE family transcriptional regulator, fatty acid utilization regulator
MTISTDHLRLILGLKVKSLRQGRGESLSGLAKRSGVSVSYLSEIENGRKYPKPEVLLRLAEGLGVGYDELVSARLEGELDALAPLLHSDFLQEFPFQLFGVDVPQLLGLVSDDPLRSAAFLQTFLEIGRAYDVNVEQFLFAALRSYQRLHDNYFPELEAAAAEFRQDREWGKGNPGALRLQRELETEHDYIIDERTMAENPDLSRLRTVFLDGARPRLLVHSALSPAQRAFVFGREIGFRVLGLSPRPETSSWVRVESFDEILNNFKASYFAGALLIHEEELVDALEDFFRKRRWDPAAYGEMMDRFEATPETFAYRLSQVLPARLGISRLYFMRFQNTVGSPDYQLTKVLNLSGVATPRGVGSREHYCRRWLALRLLREIGEADAASRSGLPPEIRGERAHFVPEEAEFFVISAARPLFLQEGVNTCITLGLLMDDAFKEKVRFWNDPGVRRRQVGMTCERCPLLPEECSVRAAPPVILEAERRRTRRVAALEALRSSSAPAGEGPDPVRGAGVDPDIDPDPGVEAGPGADAAPGAGARAASPGQG